MAQNPILKKSPISSPSPLEKLEQQNKRSIQRLAAVGIKDPTIKKNPSALERIFGVMDIPRTAVAAAVHNVVNPAGDEEVNIIEDIGRAWRGEDRTDFADILADAGVKNKWAKMLGGFVGDMLLDPVTYLSFGTAKVAKQMGSTFATHLASALGKYGDDLGKVAGAIATNMLSPAGRQIVTLEKATSVIDDLVKRGLIEKFGTVYKLKNFMPEELVAKPDAIQASREIMETIMHHFGSGGVKFMGQTVALEKELTALGYGAKSFLRNPSVLGKPMKSAAGLSRWLEAAFGHGALGSVVSKTGKRHVDILRQGDEVLNAIVKSVFRDEMAAAMFAEELGAKWVAQFVQDIPDAKTRMFITEAYAEAVRPYGEKIADAWQRAVNARANMEESIRVIRGRYDVAKGVSATDSLADEIETLEVKLAEANAELEYAMEVARRGAPQGTHYDVLGVPVNAKNEQIRLAHATLRKRLQMALDEVTGAHEPRGWKKIDDLIGQANSAYGIAPEQWIRDQMRAIDDAVMTLTDQAKRAAYNKSDIMKNVASISQIAADVASYSKRKTQLMGRLSKATGTSKKYHDAAVELAKAESEIAQLNLMMMDALQERMTQGLKAVGVADEDIARGIKFVQETKDRLSDYLTQRNAMRSKLGLKRVSPLYGVDAGGYMAGIPPRYGTEDVLKEFISQDMGKMRGAMDDPFLQSWWRRGAGDEYSEFTATGQMSGGRGSGIATGQYAFGSEEAARKGLSEGQPLTRVRRPDNPLVITKPGASAVQEGYDPGYYLFDATRKLMRLAEQNLIGEDRLEALFTAAQLTDVLGIKITGDDVIKAVETWQKGADVHPLNILLQRKGYDGIEFAGDMARYADDGTFGNIAFPMLDKDFKFTETGNRGDILRGFDRTVPEVVGAGQPYGIDPNALLDRRQMPDDLKHKTFVDPVMALTGKAQPVTAGGRVLPSQAEQVAGYLTAMDFADIARAGVTKANRDLMALGLQERLAQAVGDERVAREIMGNVKKMFQSDDATREFFTAWDRVLNWWKRGATMYRFPAFQQRNLFSNKILMFQDGVLGLDGERKSFDILVALQKGLKEGDPEKYLDDAQAALYESARRHNVMTSWYAMTEQYGPKAKLNKVGQKAASANEYIENQSRLSAYITLLNKGYDERSAAAMVDAALFNYYNYAYSYIEKGILLRVMPFIKWTKSNLTKQMRLMIENPKQITWLGHLKENAEAATGIESTEYPSYLKNLFGIPIPVEGTPILSTGGVFPQADLEKLLPQYPREYIREWLSQTQPFIRDLFFEFPLNKDIWRDKEIQTYPGELRRAPIFVETFDKMVDGVPMFGDLWDKAKDFFNMRYKYTEDGTKYLAMNPYVSKAMKDFLPWMEGVGKMLSGDPANVWSQTTGLKMIPYQPKDWQKARVYEAQDALSAAIRAAKDQGRLRKEAAKTSTEPLNTLLGR